MICRCGYYALEGKLESECVVIDQHLNLTKSEIIKCNGSLVLVNSSITVKDDCFDGPAKQGQPKITPCLLRIQMDQKIVIDNSVLKSPFVQLEATNIEIQPGGKIDSSGRGATPSDYDDGVEMYGGGHGGAGGFACQPENGSGGGVHGDLLRPSDYG